MNILFFTPAVAASAIGRASKLIVAALNDLGHEVAVVRSEVVELMEKPRHSFHGEIVRWNDPAEIRRRAQAADLVVYQVGDNLAYHRGCLEWLAAYPGVVCMHDNFLGHLFWGWSEVIGRSAAQRILEHLYDGQTARRFFDHGSSESFLQYAPDAAPMTEWIASMASGVIVHSSWALDRIAAACAGPVEVVPLAYDGPDVAPHAHPSSFGEARRVTLLTIGHVNPNKRSARVIEAIGSSPLLREKVSYRIVGAVEPDTKHRLSVLAAELGVDVHIAGAVTDDRLAAEIRQADIMGCLRWPALESASASTIEAMLYAKPTVVTDTGFYRDLPNECVFKISPENELGDLRATLERLVASSDLRQATGRAAREYALNTFRADRYAEQVVDMKSKIRQAKLVSDAAMALTQTMKRWGARGAGPIVEGLASPLSVIQ